MRIYHLYHPDMRRSILQSTPFVFHSELCKMISVDENRHLKRFDI